MESRFRSKILWILLNLKLRPRKINHPNAELDNMHNPLKKSLSNLISNLYRAWVQMLTSPINNRSIWWQERKLAWAPRKLSFLHLIRQAKSSPSTSKSFVNWSTKSTYWNRLTRIKGPLKDLGNKSMPFSMCFRRDAIILISMTNRPLRKWWGKWLKRRKTRELIRRHHLHLSLLSKQVR